MAAGRARGDDTVHPLSAVWTDPDFDPTRRAARDPRGFEIATPRWSTYDAVRKGLFSSV